MQEVSLRQVRYEQWLDDGRAPRNDDRDIVSETIRHVPRSATWSKIDVRQVRRWRTELGIVNYFRVERDGWRRNDLSVKHVADRTCPEMKVLNGSWRGCGRCECC